MGSRRERVCTKEWIVGREFQVRSEDVLKNENLIWANPTLFTRDSLSQIFHGFLIAAIGSGYSMLLMSPIFHDAGQ